MVFMEEGNIGSKTDIEFGFLIDIILYIDSITIYIYILAS
jgi:hypothetical protein